MIVDFQIGDTVVANRDLPYKQVKKGDRGVIEFIAGCDSELYLTIELETGKGKVANSCENSWDKV